MHKIGNNVKIVGTFKPYLQNSPVWYDIMSRCKHLKPIEILTSTERDIHQKVYVSTWSCDTLTVCSSPFQ